MACFEYIDSTRVKWRTVVLHIVRACGFHLPGYVKVYHLLPSSLWGATAFSLLVLILGLATQEMQVERRNKFIWKPWELKINRLVVDFSPSPVRIASDWVLVLLHASNSKNAGLGLLAIFFLLGLILGTKARVQLVLDKMFFHGTRRVLRDW